MPDLIHTCNPKCELGEVKVHIQSIKEDMAEMKLLNVKLVELFTKQMLIEEKIRACEDNRENLWKRVNKNEDRLALIEPLKETVEGWKKGMMKLKVGIGVVIFAEILRVVMQLKGWH